MVISNFSGKERDLVEAALVFANLPSIESNRQVEALFRIPKLHGVGVGHAPVVEFRHIVEGSSEYADRTQPMLRRWLERIISGNAGRGEIASEVAHLFPRDLRAIPVFSTGRLSYDFQLSGVDAGCALAAALILDPDRGLTSRLQQCTLSTCGRFSVDFDARARPRKYCNTDHRTLAHYEQSPERMRQWRKAA